MLVYRSGCSGLSSIQIYGERNSGTYFLQQLAENIAIDSSRVFGGKKKLPSGVVSQSQNHFGYKHWFLNDRNFGESRLKRDTLFIVVLRNPYSWISAMMERPYALADSIEGKAVSDLPFVKLHGCINGNPTKNEYHPVTGEALNIFELRSQKINDWMRLPSLVENCVFVKLEELIAFPSVFIDKMSRVFGFDSDFLDPPKPSRKLVSEIYDDNRFTEEERAVIDANIDWDAERMAGYHLGGSF